jgi:hypothetical protein
MKWKLIRLDVSDAAPDGLTPGMAVSSREGYIPKESGRTAMSEDRDDQEERPCLHCLVVELVDNFFAEYPAATGESDTIDTDEVITAVAKTHHRSKSCHMCIGAAEPSPFQYASWA